jgi:hypothetical protein
MENPPGIRIIKNTLTNVLHHYHCGLLQEKFDIHIVICLLELSIASNLLSLCVHTLSTCFHWYVVLVFTVELVLIFVNINRATSGSLHCCLLLEKPVSMSSSIEGQVSFIIVVCRSKNWYPYRHSIVDTVHCLKFA